MFLFYFYAFVFSKDDLYSHVFLSCMPTFLHTYLFFAYLCACLLIFVLVVVYSFYWVNSRSNSQTAT